MSSEHPSRVIHRLFPVLDPSCSALDTSKSGCQSAATGKRVGINLIRVSLNMEDFDCEEYLHMLGGSWLISRSPVQLPSTSGPGHRTGHPPDNHSTYMLPIVLPVPHSSRLVLVGV